jgi:hypothetical protein
MADDELDFFVEYNDELQEIEKAIVDERTASSGGLNAGLSVDEELVHCHKALAALDRLRAFCFSHGSSGKKYFSQMYEHCHNSRNPDFSIQEQIEGYMRYLGGFVPLTRDIIKHVETREGGQIFNADLVRAFEGDPRVDCEWRHSVRLRDIINKLIEGGFLDSEKVGNKKLIKAVSRSSNVGT